jgi:hypothetical protein
VEAVLESGLGRWLERLARAVKPHFDSGYGTYAVTYRAPGKRNRPVEVAAARLAGTRTAGLKPSLQAALRGQSDAATARERGGSPRTTANQLRSAFRKLGVTSRADLVAETRKSEGGRWR